LADVEGATHVPTGQSRQIREIRGEPAAAWPAQGS
jgi:hypothetical protein